MSAVTEASERIPTQTAVRAHRPGVDPVAGVIISDNAQYGRGSYGVRLSDGTGRIVEVESASVEVAQ